MVGAGAMTNAPTLTLTRSEALRRLANRSITMPNGCWTWTGRLDKDGYGKLSVNNQTIRSHRFAYMALRGPIPEGLVIDHLCRNRACCNPDHLEPVTPRENVMRGETPAARNAAKTHCVNGHEFTLANTYRPPLESNKRKCRSCMTEAVRRYRDTNK